MIFNILFGDSKMIVLGRVGSKGELFIPKRIRDMLSIKPNMRVIYRVEGDRLIIEFIPIIEELLELSPEVEVTLEEFHKFRRELSERAEE